MNSPNLKKLIASFLLLSALASSGVLIFLHKYESQPKIESYISFEADPNIQPAIDKNAIAEILPTGDIKLDVAREVTFDKDGLPTKGDSDNLTDNLSQNIARSIFAANPNGPQNVGGQPTLSFPDSQVLTDSVLESMTANISGKIEGELAAADQPVNIIESNSQEDAAQYLSSVSVIITKTFENPEFKQQIATDPSLDKLNAALLTYQDAYQQVGALPVPRPLLEVHRALIQTIAHQDNILVAATEYREDPLKTLVVLNTSDDLINKDIKNLYDAVTKAKVALLNNKKTGLSVLFQSFVDHAFGIPKAHAFSLGDIGSSANGVCGSLSSLLGSAGSIFGGGGSSGGSGGSVGGGVGGGGGNRVPILIQGDTSWDDYKSVENSASRGTCLQTVFDWLKKVATEALKTKIIDAIEKQVLSWISGNKQDAQFIGNWKSFLGDSFQEGAGMAIASIAPKLCQSFGSFINTSFLPTIRPTFNTYNGYTGDLSCSPKILGANMKSFFGNFSSGGFNNGWSSYSELLKPDNNLFGSIIQVHDVMATEAAQAQSAANSEAVSDSGFLGQKKCLVKAQGPPDVKGNYPCAQEQINTPGSTVSNILDQTLGSQIQRVTGSQELTDLLTKYIQWIAGTAIGELAKKGGSGLRGLTQ